MNRSTKAPAHHLPHVVRTLKAMAHPARLRMLAMLTTGELCVCKITAVLDLAASTVSGHLADLRAAGLVAERKEGKWVHYRLADDPEMSGVIRSALALLATDDQAEADAAAVCHVRLIPVENLGSRDVDRAVATGRLKICRSAGTPPKRRATPRVPAV
jgi:DNA-binding transcriptional ArsR family regulator